MIILLSPAKSLDYDSPLPTRKASQPRLLDHAEELIDVLRGKSVDEVADLMSLSLDLAVLNVERYAEFTTPFTKRNARAALVAFNGDVYQGMRARERFGERDFTEAQKTVRILSGLYGVLRPLDLIQPYRLEMGTKLRTARGDTLYDFWGSTITDLLREDLDASPGRRAVVNLASGEYSRSVDLDALDAPVIAPRFLDEGPDGTYRVVSFHTKRARGEMAAWLVLRRARSPRVIPEFDVAGYRYDPSRSTDLEPTFIRDA